MKSVVIVIMTAAVAAAATAAAQTADPSAPIPTPPAPAVADSSARTAPAFTRGVPNKTVVTIEILVPLHSKANHIGDTFPIRLAEPVLGASGDILLPAGTSGRGEVIHVARARAMGKAGEMILTVRYLRCGGLFIPLGHFKFGLAGKNNLGEAVALGLVAAPLVAFVAGGEVDVPAGTRATAKITADVALTAEASASCLGSAQ